MAYVWGSRSFTVPASVVGEAIDQIIDEEGACPPGALVDRARPESSPLHPLFTWDDSRAAESWRTHQARLVIKSVSVVIDKPEPSNQPGPPAFISVNRRPDATGAPGYQPIAVVQRSPDLMREAQRDALRALQGLQRRYSHLSELKPVWEAVRIIDEAMQEALEDAEAA
jgi:hypothetical protein